MSPAGAKDLDETRSIHIVEEHPRMKVSARFNRIASCLALLGCAHKKEMSQSPVLKKLDLEGPQHVSKRELEKRIATAETG